jgi:hypothetical protein
MITWQSSVVGGLLTFQIQPATIVISLCQKIKN